MDGRVKLLVSVFRVYLASSTIFTIETWPASQGKNDMEPYWNKLKRIVKGVVHNDIPSYMDSMHPQVLVATAKAVNLVRVIV